MSSAQQAVDSAITSRRSIRAFTQQPVAHDLIVDILQVARYAASSTNCQPWKVYVLQGDSRKDLVNKVCQAHDSMGQFSDDEKKSWKSHAIKGVPDEWISPFRERRRVDGLGLYSLLGVTKDNMPERHRLQQRNYRFFDAPVGLILTIDKVAPDSWLLDYGMFMQSIALAAGVRGLDTCFQGAWGGFSHIVMPHIGAGENEKLVNGIALGYSDTGHLINSHTTTREPVDSFTTWLK